MHASGKVGTTRSRTLRFRWHCRARRRSVDGKTLLLQRRTPHAREQLLNVEGYNSCIETEVKSH